LRLPLAGAVSLGLPLKRSRLGGSLCLGVFGDGVAVLALHRFAALDTCDHHPFRWFWRHGTRHRSAGAEGSDNDDEQFAHFGLSHVKERLPTMGGLFCLRFSELLNFVSRM
jgi:hypothetical protein